MYSKSQKFQLVVMQIIINLFLLFADINISWAQQPNHQKIDYLIEQLDYINENTKSAIDSLVAIGKPALPKLIQVFKKQNTLRRIYIAEILTQMAEMEDVTSALPALVQIFEEDKNPGVRIEIAEALGSMREDAAPSVNVLIQALKDENTSVRINVIRALGNIGEKATPAIPTLIPALQDKNIWVRHAVITALAGISQRPELVVPTLIQTLNDQDAGIRDSSAFALGILQKKAVAAVPHLIKVSQDENTEVRRRALEALGYIKENPESCVPVLIQALQDKEIDVRIKAIESLGAFSTASTSAVPALLKVLKEKNPLIRKKVLFALGDIKLGVKPNSQLLQALKDDNVWLRIGAAYALIHTEEKINAIKTLNSALSFPNIDARITAANILLRDDKVTSAAFLALIDGFKVPEMYVRQFTVPHLSTVSRLLQQRARSLSNQELEIAIANLELALKIIPDPKLKILTIPRHRRWLLPHIKHIRTNLAAIKQEQQERQLQINQGSEAK